MRPLLPHGAPLFSHISPNILKTARTNVPAYCLVFTGHAGLRGRHMVSLVGLYGTAG